MRTKLHFLQIISNNNLILIHIPVSFKFSKTKFKFLIRLCSTFCNSAIQSSFWIFLSTLRNKATQGHPHSAYAQKEVGRGGGSAKACICIQVGEGSCQYEYMQCNCTSVPSYTNTPIIFSTSIFICQNADMSASEFENFD